jgi:hypothetical protein
MRLKGSLDLEVRRENSNYAIITTEKEVVGARTDATDLIIVQKGRAIIIWRPNLANLEEIEGFPLIQSGTSFCFSWPRTDSPKLMP